MSAFDSQDYVNKFGPMLQAASESRSVAGPDEQGAGSADPGDGAFGASDPDADQSIAQTQAGSKNVAPMPGSRQMFGSGSPEPPKGMAAAKGGALAGGADASTGAPANLGVTGQSPDQEAANSAHAVSMDNISDADLKSYQKYLDGHLENTGMVHGETGEKLNFDALYQHTFHNSLADHAALADMTEKQASKFTNPSWRDKVGMFLDAQNRASIIHAQNPSLAPGDIWALATRNALQGWASNAKGMHDAVVQQTGALQEQARKDANDAIKRQMDQANYGDVIAKARKANADARKGDSEAALKEADLPTEARLREAEIAEKQASGADKKAQAAKAANDKGTLVTVKNDDGTESTGYIDQKTNVFTPAKDASGKPIGGQVQKTGTEKAENDDKLMTQAREAYQAEVKNIRSNVRNRKLSDKEVAQQALDTLKTTSPRLYAAYTKSADSERPSKAGVAAKAKAPKTASWDTD